MSDAIDRTYSLGIAQMPEGYQLLQLDSGHYMWRHDESDDESCIHWNKWAIYQSAKLDAAKRVKP